MENKYCIWWSSKNFSLKELLQLFTFFHISKLIYTNMKDINKSWLTYYQTPTKHNEHIFYNELIIYIKKYTYCYYPNSVFLMEEIITYVIISLNKSKHKYDKDQEFKKWVSGFIRFGMLDSNNKYRNHRSKEAQYDIVEDYNILEYNNVIVEDYDLKKDYEKEKNLAKSLYLIKKLKYPYNEIIIRHVENGEKYVDMAKEYNINGNSLNTYKRLCFQLIKEIINNGITSPYQLRVFDLTIEELKNNIK